MPNGFVGSEEEWQRLEAPLKAVDVAVSRFARDHQCSVKANYHSWPSRELKWDRGDGIVRRISISLDDESGFTFSVRGEASRGRERARWIGSYAWRSIEFGRLASPLESVAVLDVLDRAYQRVDGLTREELGRVKVSLPLVTRITPLAVRHLEAVLQGCWSVIKSYLRGDREGP